MFTMAEYRTQGDFFMNEKVKHRHHYVFQAYLKAWAKKKMIWYSNNGMVSQRSIKSVGYAYDFYKLNRASNKDEKLILNLVPKYELGEVKKIIDLNNEFITSLQSQEYLLSIIEHECYDFVKSKAARQEIADSIAQVRNNLKVGLCNTLENFLGDIEKEGVEQWLAELRKGNIDFYYQVNQEVRKEFLSFVCIQYFRTRALRERMTRNIKKEMDEERLRKMDINIDVVQRYMAWTFSANCTDALFNMQARVRLLVNKSEIEFITGDQPVINLCADYKKSDVEPDKLIFYYPLSPSYSVIINENENNDKYEELTEEQVDYYNKKIVDASYEQYYASSKEMTERYLN